MKKFLSMAALALVGAMIAACSSSSDEIIDKQPENPTMPKVYTMTVTASKADNATTRALSLDGTTLNATWAKGEKVDVYTVTSGATITDPSVYTKVGTLTASADGATATLTGTVTFSGKPTLELYYGSPSWTYEGQKGTLEDISANFDYAMVRLTLSKYDITDGVITPTTSPLSFTNQQAIVKFTLKDADGDPISVRSLTFKKTGTKYFNLNYNVNTTATTNDESFTVERDEAASEFFVAFRPIYDFGLRLETADADRDYYYERTNVAFDGGKYYEVTVKMKQRVDLSKLDHNLTAINGDVITGTLANNVKISIADGATVTLSDATINGVHVDEAYEWAGITCLGDATIKLEGTNKVKGFNKSYPGIFVPANKTLTIQGDGSLDASQNGGAAGIGCGPKEAGGNIMIEGGNITATGCGGSGIGGSGERVCGNITITGGTITATGTRDGPTSGGAGIGGCGNIIISGGSITASGDNGAGIGSNLYKGCGNITISGGTIVASGDTGIGSRSGAETACGDITISGGTIQAKGSESGAAIGSGYLGFCGDILISGGNVEATFDDVNRSYAAGIGSGERGYFKSINITYGITRVKATAGKAVTNVWPIGKGNEDNGSGSVTIGNMPVYGMDWNGAGIATNLRFDNSVNKTWLLWDPNKWTP